MLWSTCSPVRTPDVSLDAPDPPILTWTLFSLCITNQRSFIRDLIRELSYAGKPLEVSFSLALPTDPIPRTAGLQILLLHDVIIRKTTTQRWEGNWVHLARWGRRTLPYGRFECQEDQYWY